jgi:hypothetical protein
MQKLRILKMIVFHCFPHGAFIHEKANVKDSSNKLSDQAASWHMFNPFFEAIQFPKKHTQKTRPIWVIQLNLS